MELRLRKRINNLPKFYSGTDLAALDAKVGLGQQNTANDLTKMIGGNAPIGSSIAGGGSSSASFNIGQKPFLKWNQSGGIKTGGFNASNINAAGAIQGIAGMIGGFNSMQNAVKGDNELMALSGQRTDLAFGVNYQAHNDINRDKAMADILSSNKANTLGMVGSGAAAGAAIGSAFPGLGTVIGGAAGAVVGLIGGLFGSKKAREKQRKKIFNAQLKVNLTNLINQSSAATEGLTLQYYLDNGNTYDDVLYANRGKDLRRPKYVKRK